MIKEKELCYRITGCVYEVYRLDLLVEGTMLCAIMHQKYEF
jgi:hypothetical protein